MSILTTIANIQENWALLFPGAPVPDQRQCALWLNLHPEQTVRAAIAKLAIKQGNGTAPTINLDRFASSIMDRIDAQRAVKTAPVTTETVDGQEQSWNR
jgi:hypothetical protein